MKFKYVVSLLRTLKIPGFFPLMKDWQALVRLHFIYAALESGLLEALRIPASREVLIRKLDVARPEILDALLDVGVATKELDRTGGKFSVKGKRSKAMIGQEGDMLSAMVQANITYYHSAYFKATARLKGGPLGDDLAKIGDLVARFSKIGEPIIKQFLTGLTAEKKPLRILDVGCGSGIHLKTIFEVNANAFGIGIDIDAVVSEQARRNMEGWGLGNRFRIVTGDVRVPPEPLGAPFDLIILLNIFLLLPGCGAFGIPEETTFPAVRARNARSGYEFSRPRKGLGGGPPEPGQLFSERLDAPAGPR